MCETQSRSQEHNADQNFIADLDPRQRRLRVRAIHREHLRHSMHIIGTCSQCIRIVLFHERIAITAEALHRFAPYYLTISKDLAAVRSPS